MINNLSKDPEYNTKQIIQISNKIEVYKKYIQIVQPYNTNPKYQLYLQIIDDNTSIMSKYCG